MKKSLETAVELRIKQLERAKVQNSPNDLIKQGYDAEIADLRSAFAEVRELEKHALPKK